MLNKCTFHDLLQYTGTLTTSLWQHTSKLKYSKTIIVITHLWICALRLVVSELFRQG